VVVIEDIELYYNVRFDVKNCVADLTSIMFFSLWDGNFYSGSKTKHQVLNTSRSSCKK
jgi:hypothetical protein